MVLERESDKLLNDTDFNFICQFVYQQAGIVLNQSKREMVYRRLTRIIRERHLSSFAEYCALLRAQPEQEIDYFINAITTNLTSFFREKHHFEYLAETEIPRLLQNKGKAHKPHLRIWSAACSTGEEPYSIAITLLKTMKKELSHWDAKILATDIDSNVIAKSKLGVYDKNKLKEIGSSTLANYFDLINDKTAARIKTNVKQLITFKQLNLLHEWPMKGLFDVIFCRNVIIYFDKKTQQELFARFYEKLKPGGLLILGHSENLGAYQKYFTNESRTVFRKPDQNEPLTSENVREVKSGT
jgi:chemotaxis protein methyltransferase CheR